MDATDLCEVSGPHHGGASWPGQTRATRLSRGRALGRWSCRLVKATWQLLSFRHEPHPSFSALDNQFRMSILERLEQMERRMAEMTGSQQHKPGGGGGSSGGGAGSGSGGGQAQVAGRAAAASRVVARAPGGRGRPSQPLLWAGVIPGRKCSSGLCCHTLGSV